MKKLFLLISLLFIAQTVAFTQSTVSKEQIIKIYTDCINTQSTAEIEPLLDEQFSMMGHKQPIALKILQATIKTFNDKVTESEFLNEEKTDSGIAFNYDITLEKLGKRTHSISLTEQGKIKEISISGVGAQQKNIKLNMQSTTELANTINIPFQLIGQLIIVKASLNGQEGYWFFDSGAPSLVLNSVYYKNTDPTAAKQTAIGSKGVSGDASGVSVHKIKSFNFAGIQAKESEVLKSDMSNLEEKGVRIEGLIGYDVIKDFDVLYDYANKTITLIKKDYVEKYIQSLKTNNTKVFEAPMQQRGHIPYVTTTINNKAYTVGIDCGATVNLLDDSKFEEVKSQTKNLKTRDLRGFNSGKVQRKYGKIKKMTIGDVSFKSCKTVFSDISHLNTDKNLKLDGLIGYPVLSKQKCIVSYHTGKLIFIE